MAIPVLAKERGALTNVEGAQGGRFGAIVGAILLLTGMLLGWNYPFTQLLGLIVIYAMWLWLFGPFFFPPGLQLRKRGLYLPAMKRRS
jgi:hypothetical protein